MKIIKFVHQRLILNPSTTSSQYFHLQYCVIKFIKFDFLLFYLDLLLITLSTNNSGQLFHCYKFNSKSDNNFIILDFLLVRVYDGRWRWEQQLIHSAVQPPPPPSPANDYTEERRKIAEKKKRRKEAGDNVPVLRNQSSSYASSFGNSWRLGMYKDSSLYSPELRLVCAAAEVCGRRRLVPDAAIAEIGGGFAKPPRFPSG